MLDATILWNLYLSGSVKEVTVYSFVDKAYTGSDWKSKQGDNATARRDSSTMYRITNWGIPKEDTNLHCQAWVEKCLNERNFEIRGQAWSKAMWIGGLAKGQRDQDSAKHAQRHRSLLRPGWGKLRCSLNLKLCLSPLTCFCPKQIINRFRVIIGLVPVSPHGDFVNKSGLLWNPLVISRIYKIRRRSKRSINLYFDLKTQSWGQRTRTALWGVLQGLSEIAWIKDKILLRKISKKWIVFLHRHFHLYVNRTCMW